MDDKIKIYKYLAVFLWIFSSAVMIYYYSRINNCPQNIAGLCYNAASADNLNFKPAGENFPDLESLRNSNKDILNIH